MPNDYLEHQIEGMYAAMAGPDLEVRLVEGVPGVDVGHVPSARTATPQGYFMTDPIGRAFIEAGLKLGVPNFAIHKGLPIPGFDVTHNEPTDIGPDRDRLPGRQLRHLPLGDQRGHRRERRRRRSRRRRPRWFPTARRTRSRSASTCSSGRSSTSGVIHDPDTRTSRRRSRRALNVYAEMGSAWSQVMNDTNQSQHYIGKLLKYLGPGQHRVGDRLHPQRQPAGADRALSRTSRSPPQYQEKYGYPAITDAIKEKIFGLNAAKHLPRRSDAACAARRARARSR